MLPLNKIGKAGLLYLYDTSKTKHGKSEIYFYNRKMALRNMNPPQAPQQKPFRSYLVPTPTGWKTAKGIPICLLWSSLPIKLLNKGSICPAITMLSITISLLTPQLWNSGLAALTAWAKRAANLKIST